MKKQTSKFKGGLCGFVKPIQASQIPAAQGPLFFKGNK